MEIVLERSRIIFSEYSDQDKNKIDNLVATMDKVFTFEDTDNAKIYLPPGMLESIKKLFPNIKIQNKSTEFWPYAYIHPVEHTAKPRNQLQIDFINFLLQEVNKKNKVAGILSPGTGKCNPVSMKLPSPNGYIKMGDLKVGDLIFGSDGKKNTVEEIYERGIQDVYKITFSDGRTSLCGKDHLWNVKSYNLGKWKTKTTEEIMKDYKTYSEATLIRSKEEGISRDPYIYKYRIPLLSAPVDYNSREVPVDPYTIGALIGNGCLTENPLAISCGDDFVPNQIANHHNLICRKNPGSFTYYFYNPLEYKMGNKKRIQTDDFLNNVPELINKYSGEKTIPEIYMYNDLNVRLGVLRGLMDTDGSIDNATMRYHVTYSSTSKTLLLQIQELVRGLGFSATIIDDNRSWKYKNGYHGEIIFNIPHHLKPLFFSHPGKSYIAKKAALIPKQKQQPYEYLIIKDIQFSHKERSRCIKVSADDSLYLAENFIVTHNTFMACYAGIKVGLRMLIIAPTTNVKNQWADTLIRMFNVPSERVVVVNSPKDFVNVNGDFVVVSQASLAVLNKNYDLEKIMKENKFGIKVIDEVQMWFHNIIKVDGSSNICHNWYLTGTFGRSADDENTLYQEMFGDLSIFREKDKTPTLLNRKPGNVYGMKPHMNVKMIWTHSGLSKEEIKKVTSSKRYSEREGRWIRYGISIPAYTNLIIPPDGKVTRFMKKIFEVIKMANREVQYGRMLVLSATIESTEILARHLREMYPDLIISTIHSKNPKQSNDKAKAEADIMVSTVKSSGTGFDAKGLSKLIVTEQFKSWILADQVSGRLRRRDDGKETYMWDIVDADIGQLRAWANVRASVLKKKSKKFTVADL